MGAETVIDGQAARATSPTRGAMGGELYESEDAALPLEALEDQRDHVLALGVALAGNASTSEPTRFRELFDGTHDSLRAEVRLVVVGEVARGTRVLRHSATIPRAVIKDVMTGETHAVAPLPQNGSITIRTRGVELEPPELVARAGQRAAEASFEFFTARIPNAHTRDAYGRAFRRFAAWCMSESPPLPLEAITPPAIGAYLAELEAGGMSAASRKLHLAALRHWLDWLCQRGVLPFNPAASVRGPKLIVREGRTPVLERDEARLLFESVGHQGLVALRDRSILAVMLFGFVRVGAVCRMMVKDFEDAGGDAWLVLHEKGGKERRVPCHHQARDYLRTYVAAAGLDAPERRREPLFQTARGRTGELTRSAMRRTDVLAMVKRRAAAAALPPSICSHSFRATGITIHQENGGRLEEARELAGHADSRTTQLYNRTMRKIARAEVERVQL